MLVSALLGRTALECSVEAEGTGDKAFVSFVGDEGKFGFDDESFVFLRFKKFPMVGIGLTVRVKGFKVYA